MRPFSTPIGEDDRTRDLRKTDLLKVAEDALAEAISPGPFRASPAVSNAASRGAASVLASLDENSSGRMFLGYKLHECIGSGGMGKVYRAEQIWLGRAVAIKIMHEALAQDGECAARFLRETRAVGQLDHPNIVRATDAGEIEGRCYLVTELLPGIDLADLVARRGPLTVGEACAAICQAAAALQYAHERGMVHRDVKPSNLMLVRGGRVKLLDFGLARLSAHQTTLTAVGQVMGTLDFMAPEQAGDSRRVDVRADIYSLGCTLHYLLSGQAPFSGPECATPAGKIRAHEVQPPRPIDELRGDVPAKVARMLARMLAKAPGDRPHEPADVATVLAPFADDARLAALVEAPENGGRRVPSAPSLVRMAVRAPLKVAGGMWRWAFGPSRHHERYGASPPRRSRFSLTGLIAIGLILAFLHYSGFFGFEIVTEEDSFVPAVKPGTPVNAPFGDSTMTIQGRQ